MYQSQLRLIKEETLAQVFSCEFCEIFKNISRRLLLDFGWSFIDLEEGERN